MRRSLLVSVAVALSCLGAGAGGFLAGRAGGPDLKLTVRAGSLAGARSGSQVGARAGDSDGYRAGYKAGSANAYWPAYRLAYRRAAEH